MWPLGPAGFPGGGGEAFVSEAARLGLGGGGANEAARLVWLLGPAGFPEGSGEKRKKKQFIHSVIQSECCSQKYCSPRALLLVAAR